MKKEHQIGVLIHSKSPQKAPFLPVTHTRKRVTTSRARGCGGFKNQNESVTVRPLAKRRRGKKQDTRKMDLLQKKQSTRALSKEAGMQMEGPKWLMFCGGTQAGLMRRSHRLSVGSANLSAAGFVAGGPQIWLPAVQAVRDMNV